MIKSDYKMRKRLHKPKPQVEEISEEDIAQFKTEDGFPVQTLYVSGFGSSSPNVQTLMSSFANDGPIKKVSINDTGKIAYAFVTFSDVKSALKAQKTPHYFNRRRLILRPADSWHQPQDWREPSDNDEEIDMEQSILKLNDDCLFCIFSYLNLRDLAVMEKVCTRFQTVAESIYKSQHVLDFDQLAESNLITLMEVKNISTKLGCYVHTLKASSTSFRTINIRVLNTILKHCTNLQTMYLEGFHINTPFCLTLLAKAFGKLKIAALENCSITDELAGCLRDARELEVLNLTQNSEIRGECLVGLRKIKEINLSYCQNLQPYYFVQFCERNPELRELNIIRCDKINHLCLEAMSKHLKNLESLMICNSYATVSPGDYVILGDMPNLTHLQVNYNNFLNVDTFLARLADRDRLEYLDISSGHLTRNTLRALVNFSKLKVLKLNYKIECVDDTLMLISSTETLQELHIMGCTSITNEGLVAFITKCRALRYINMSGCYGITNDLVINILPLLDERTQPLELIVGGTQISPAVEEQISLAENIKIKLNYSNTANSFCSIDEWEDMLYGDDDPDLDDIDDLDDDDIHPFAFFDNGYDDSDFDDELLFEI
ncbi:uncharacterized protein LOC129808829 isoform X2 [Phlebotomus papatasi]|uniref:uncharacterized protein LOC129808829 isoform X2 n=1 Tax=Phlebotomus papatasi TaxID=29031 RepID=UPI0024844458|nr:uncharacterized protein LOC129808829 isoform X2 [Phlebotomus papatasi]